MPNSQLRVAVKVLCPGQKNGLYRVNRVPLQLPQSQIAQINKRMPSYLSIPRYLRTPLPSWIHMKTWTLGSNRLWRAMWLCYAKRPWLTPTKNGIRSLRLLRQRKQNYVKSYTGLKMNPRMMWFRNSQHQARSSQQTRQITPRQWNLV